jgi:hypothetical protein
MALQPQSTPPDTFGIMRQDELLHWRDHYAARLAHLADEITEDRPAMSPDELATYAPAMRAYLLASGATAPVGVAVLRASTAAFLRGLIADIDAELARRVRYGSVRTATAGLPQFPKEWLLDLKRRVHLDGLFEHEAGLHLQALTRTQQRSGPCPFCGGDAGSTRFRLYLAEQDAERFHCFACAADGDAIRAIELLYGVGFRDACTILATHAGLPLPASMAEPEPAPKPAAKPYRKRHRGAFLPP